MDGARHSIGLVWAGVIALAGCGSAGDPCRGIDCGAHGSCAEVEGAAVCNCDPGYVADGLACIVDPCTQSPCVYGSCRPSGRNAICDCYPGYAGARCDSCAPGYRLEGMACIEGSACDDDPCVYGRCHSEGGLPVCDCLTGYAGAVCDRCAAGYHPVGLECVSDSPCDPDPCVHGSCSVAGGRAVCDCDEGYAGPSCDSCAPGYHAEGLECMPDVAGPCDPNPCDEAHRHVCQVEGDGYVCLCDPGYHDQGGICVEDAADPCQPNPCQQVHRTVCQPDGGGHVCLCDAGYHDQDGVCVADSACSPNPCIEPNRGVCQLDGDGHVCLCDPGYHDEAGACVADQVCDPATTCSGHGSCTGDGLECDCDAGWAGAHCAGCAAGYHPDGGDCVPDSACEPNPCQQVHRTRCVEDGAGHVCLCDAGYQDVGGLCVGVCDTVVDYQPGAGEDISALYIRGGFNDWALSDPFTENGDGSWTAVLSLPAGDYAYKLYEAGEDRWFEDPGNPFFMWNAGIRNSRLRVRDCDRPRLRLVDQPAVDAAAGTVAFQVEYIDGAQAAGADAASCSAGRNDAPLAGAFAPDSGVFSIDDQDLAEGKYAYRFRACDAAGRCAEPLYVPVWVESEDFAWRDAVLYFAMTDRFVNGDMGNDAPVGDPVDYKADWQGGDFAGLLQKIESGYFEDLGVDAIWISSVTQNTGGYGHGLGGDQHQYSAYHSYWPIATGWREGVELPGVQPVDPHFGDLDELKAVVRAAHARGIRVLVDFVANHVHADSPLWQQHQADDPPWFHLPTYVCGWDQPVICWFTDYLPDFEYKTLAVMDAVVEHAIWLIRETDVDGFRLDAVKHMIDDLALTLRGRIEQAITTTGERFYMVGETFTGEGEGEAALIRHYVRPEMLDGQFDFPLYWSLVATFLREERDFFALEQMLSDFEGFYGGWAVMSNFLGNHDVCRAVSHASGDIGDLWGNGSQEQGWNNPPADPADETPYRRLRLAWTFLMTVPGVPLIYYGDEFGLAGAGDPDNRRMMRFGAELNSHQQATLAHVQALTAVRHAHPALRRGQRSQLFNDGAFWAYAMVDGADRVVVVFNRNPAPATRALSVAAAGLGDGTVMRDVLHDSQQTVSGGELSVTLDGRDSAVFVVE